MSYESLLVYVDASELADKRVRLAASVADRFDAVLIGLSALAIRPNPISS